MKQLWRPYDVIHLALRCVYVAEQKTLELDPTEFAQELEEA